MKKHSVLDRRRCRGLSMVELMVSLAISAALLAATMVAVDVSFKAYADAVEQSSTQASSRMVTNRLLTLIRTNIAHGPLVPNALANPPVTLNGNVITSSFITLETLNGDLIRVEHRPATNELWLITTPAGGGADQPQPMLGGVTGAQFFLSRRLNDDGIWVLDRGTMDLTIEPDADATLAMESSRDNPIRIIASTKPRKIQ